ncbi:hypothetical protein, partial [uncultured Legionella sp.]|uniref:hypothetical protein n=1 Tax=uncultured Legionella sp. TaxID=210934 RepID=UPI002630C81C
KNRFIGYSLDWQRIVWVCREISYLPAKNPTLQSNTYGVFRSFAPHTHPLSNSPPKGRENNILKLMSLTEHFP